MKVTLHWGITQLCVAPCCGRSRRRLLTNLHTNLHKEKQMKENTLKESKPFIDIATECHAKEASFTDGLTNLLQKNRVYYVKKMTNTFIRERQDKQGPVKIYSPYIKGLPAGE